MQACRQLEWVRLLMVVGLTLLASGCKKKLSSVESRCVRLCKKIKDCGIGRSSANVAQCKAGCLDNKQRAPEQFQALWNSLEPFLEQTCEHFERALIAVRRSQRKKRHKPKSSGQGLAAAGRSHRTGRPEPESKPKPVKNVPCHRACAKLVECLGIEVVGDVTHCVRQCHAEIESDPLEFARKWKLVSPHLDSPCPEFNKAVFGKDIPGRTKGGVGGATKEDQRR